MQSGRAISRSIVQQAMQDLTPSISSVSQKPTSGFQPELKTTEGILAVSTRQLMVWVRTGGYSSGVQKTAGERLYNYR